MVVRLGAPRAGRWPDSCERSACRRGSLPLEVDEAAALCRKPPRRPIGPARTRQVLRRETKTEASGAGLPLPDICIAALTAYTIAFSADPARRVPRCGAWSRQRAANE